MAQLGIGGPAIIAAEAVRTVSRHGGDYPIRDLADATVQVIRNIQVAGGVQGYPVRFEQLRAGRRSVVAAETRGPVPSDRGDYPVHDLADSIVIEVGNI